jgi:hypothetical protein
MPVREVTKSSVKKPKQTAHKCDLVLVNGDHTSTTSLSRALRVLLFVSLHTLSPATLGGVPPESSVFKNSRISRRRGLISTSPGFDRTNCQMSVTS